VDVLLDVVGGDVLKRSAALVRATGTVVTVVAPVAVHPRTVFFVVEPDRNRLADLADRARDGRLKPFVGDVRPLAEAADAFAGGRRGSGKTILRPR
jgi:NADPH:quinone reductase-like Zn-dependent oxidoreductase